MAFTVENINRLAKQAKIRITEVEKAALAKDLAGILDWVTQLQQVMTEGVKNYSDIYREALYEREDRVSDGNYVADILVNAPAAEHNMFVVPKVIE